MQEKISNSTFIVNSWPTALANVRFRNKTIIGVTILLSILIYFPYFFAFIEQREQGIVINDWLLQLLAPRDFSIPIFITIWSTFTLFVFRSISQPILFINVVYSVILLSLTRMASIYLVHLEPPLELIKLKDPLTSITYGGKDLFMTKDLFFSGHTSNMLLLALCFQKKNDRIFAMTATILVGILVLFQHVHYTIDIVGAVFFTFILVPIAKKLAAL